MNPAWVALENTFPESVAQDKTLYQKMLAQYPETSPNRHAWGKTKATNSRWGMDSLTVSWKNLGQDRYFFLNLECLWEPSRFFLKKNGPQQSIVALAAWRAYHNGTTDWGWTGKKAERYWSGQWGGVGKPKQWTLFMDLMHFFDPGVFRVAMRQKWMILCVHDM